jgi:N-acyl-phosphatidylethanolamine-hydrolysing phospholipase D
VDAVIISHNHFDHLDTGSVVSLASRRPAPMFFVPLGMRSFMADLGVSNCVEMDWSESVSLTDSTGGGRSDLVVTSVPVQHWCRRGITDGNKCLWCGWVCETGGASYFFGGDTGYCSMFKRIGDALGRSCPPLATVMRFLE